MGVGLCSNWMKAGALNLQRLLDIKESGQPIDSVSLDIRTNLYNDEVQPWAAFGPHSTMPGLALALSPMYRPGFPRRLVCSLVLCAALVIDSRQLVRAAWYDSPPFAFQHAHDCLLKEYTMLLMVGPVRAGVRFRPLGLLVHHEFPSRFLAFDAATWQTYVAICARTGREPCLRLSGRHNYSYGCSLPHCVPALCALRHQQVW